jgi:hypothetical protein
MFSSEDNQADFFDYLEKECYLKNSCDIDPENMAYNKTINSGTDQEHYDLVYLKMSDMIS